jgi:hypothetical protein
MFEMAMIAGLAVLFSCIVALAVWGTACEFAAGGADREDYRPMLVSERESVIASRFELLFPGWARAAGTPAVS